MDQSVSGAWYPMPFETQGDYRQSVCFWRDGFSSEEIRRIRELGEAAGTKEAKVGGDESTQILDVAIRACELSWITPNEETLWLFDKMSRIAWELNRKNYDFNLSGISAMQYTVYDASKAPAPGAHYDWHTDTGFMTPDAPMRKITLSMQLSDPHDYEGGELWAHGSDNRVVMPKDKGLIWAFPSYTLHRVTPVTAGVRRSLIAWFVGPRFK